jgi:hypothetical protein
MKLTREQVEAIAKRASGLTGRSARSNGYRFLWIDGEDFGEYKHDNEPPTDSEADVMAASLVDVPNLCETLLALMGEPMTETLVGYWRPRADAAEELQRFLDANPDWLVAERLDIMSIRAERKGHDNPRLSIYPVMDNPEADRWRAYTYTVRDGKTDARYEHGPTPAAAWDALRAKLEGKP